MPKITHQYKLALRRIDLASHCVLRGEYAQARELLAAALSGIDELKYSQFVRMQYWCVLALVEAGVGNTKQANKCLETVRNGLGSVPPDTRRDIKRRYDAAVESIRAHGDTAVPFPR